MLVTHVGSTSVWTLTRPLYLQNVLVTPQIVKNLLSMHRLITDNNLAIEFDPFDLTVKDFTTKAAIHRCNNDNGLYPVLSNSAPDVASVAYTATVSWLTDLWHRHLGHPGTATYSNKVFPQWKKILA